jgi:hypothetical protein
VDIEIKNTRRLQTEEIKFMRHTAGYSLLGHIRNEDILQELKGDSGEMKLAQYKQNG